MGGGGVGEILRRWSESTFKMGAYGVLAMSSESDRLRRETDCLTAVSY
jgi:hypothetical protein